MPTADFTRPSSPSPASGHSKVQGIFQTFARHGLNQQTHGLNHTTVFDALMLTTT